MATTTIATILKADWTPTLEKAARIAGIVIAYAIAVVTITADSAYDLGCQTREAIDARNDQLAALARATVEAIDGIAIEFQEIVVPAEVPVLMAASGPIALLAAAPAPARKSRAKTTKTTKATKASATADAPAPAPAPARKRAPRKTAKVAVVAV
jgi:hypothetical protein